jgi:PAS domain S-box-containing protein
MEDKKIINIQLNKSIEKSFGTNPQVKKIIEKTDVGTWEWNIQTGEMIFSDKWAKIIGYNNDELSIINAKKLEEITHPDDYIKSKELLEKHFSGKLPYYKYESRLMNKNGDWVWVCQRGCLTSRTDDGLPLIMFGTYTDITKRKQIEQALENYINTLNHDLRSPLALITGYSSYILEEDLSMDEVKKYSTIINETGKKMLKMMESYLSLAKIERGQDIIGKNSKTINEISKEIKNIFIGLNNKNKFEIIFRDLKNEIQNKTLANKQVLIDESLFYSLINNIITNAIEASLIDEDKIIINIYEEKELCLSFYNAGEIPKEFQKKLFRKFISNKINGTGMGLYSARLIARAHGGDILYQAVTGGTRFILKIPFS